MQSQRFRDNEELEDLLAEVALADQRSFRQLYLETSPYIYGVLLRVLKHEAAAEDALQETFLRVWDNAKTYDRSQGKPLTWITSIARYHALDILRSQKSSLRRDTEYARLDELPSTSIIHNLDTEIGNGQILSICLDRIDPAARDCVVNAYCGGYTHEELSQQTGRALGTVKSWIKRALKALRECVDELS